MWNPDAQPTLSLEELSKRLGKSVRETKALMEEYWRVKRGEAYAREKRVAARLHREGPQRRREDMAGAVPVSVMSKLRWLELHRAMGRE